jgi:hypothetical protein
MPTYWNTIQKIKRVEAMANKMGFEFSPGRDHYIDSGDSIHLIPLGDSLPHYRRGAEIFSGSVEDIGTWLEGLLWARNYDEMLRVSNEKKRTEREQVERNKQLLQMVKTGKKVEGEIGFDTTYDFANEDEVEEDDIPF